VRRRTTTCCTGAHPSSLFVLVSLSESFLMNRGLDLEALRLRQSPKPATGLRTTRPHRTALFLKGPIPWAWLVSAGRLPGKALHVALVLHLLRGLQRNARVHLESKHVRSFGFSRHSANRGLARLERAGLVAVERRPGRSHMVTILEISSEPTPGRHQPEQRL
jgi:hypothetical protein